MLSSQPTSRIRIDFTLIKILTGVNGVHGFAHNYQGAVASPLYFFFIFKIENYKVSTRPVVSPTGTRSATLRYDR